MKNYTIAAQTITTTTSFIAMLMIGDEDQILVSVNSEDEAKSLVDRAKKLGYGWDTHDVIDENGDLVNEYSDWNHYWPVNGDEPWLAGYVLTSAEYAEAAIEAEEKRIAEEETPEAYAAEEADFRMRDIEARLKGERIRY